MKDPIYAPKGKAAEYADLALNLYTGCTNGCEYCYAPSVLRKSREDFTRCVEPRKGILEALERQLLSGDFAGKTIHLCFTCDPFPSGVDTQVARDAIELLKGADANVQILTKNPSIAAHSCACQLGKKDSIGTTITGAPQSVEPNAESSELRLSALEAVHDLGIGTWISCEPIIDPEVIYELISTCDFVDLFKFGKLNYATSDLDWAQVGKRVERLCREHDRCYMIKDSLRKEMVAR